jgi:Hint domain
MKQPQAGAPCNMPGASCGRDCDLVIRCDGGVWQWIRASCPICAAPDTPIATPDGDRPIASLAAGDLVYSVDHDAIVAVPLVLVGHTPVALHRVVRVVLSTGAVLQMSPGHRTADGRRFDELTPGARFDPLHTVLSVELVPYRYDATYDALPASSTGTYFAAGALVASTLQGPAGASASSADPMFTK